MKTNTVKEMLGNPNPNLDIHILTFDCLAVGYDQ